MTAVILNSWLVYLWYREMYLATAISFAPPTNVVYHPWRQAGPHDPEVDEIQDCTYQDWFFTAHFQRVRDLTSGLVNALRTSVRVERRDASVAAAVLVSVLIVWSGFAFLRFQKAIKRFAVLIPLLLLIVTGCAGPHDQHPQQMQAPAASPRLPPGYTELEPYYIRNSLPDPVVVTFPDARDPGRRARLIIRPGEEKGIPYPSENFCASLSRGPQVPSQIPDDVTVQELNGSAEHIALLRDHSGIFVVHRAPAPGQE